MIVRFANIDDINDIVRIHQESFPGYFMTQLGRRFLTAYYLLYIRHKHIILVAESKDEIVGFISGTENEAVFYDCIKSSWYLFLLPLCQNVFNVGVYKKITRKIFNVVFFDNVNSSISCKDNFAEIMSIAVSTPLSGKGVGTLLLQAFSEICVSNRCSGIMLTTDVENNNGVLDFYSKNGFKIINKFSQDRKREMFVLEHSFDKGGL